MNKIALILGGILLAGCSPDPGKDQSAANSDTQEASGPEVTIRWTSYGIPHIQADDWRSLGYGTGYANARDAICVLAEEIVTVTGERARYFGAGESDGNVNSDIFHRALLSDAAVENLQGRMNNDTAQMTSGFVAGYNRYLADHRGNLPAACQGKDWVRPIDRDDWSRVTIGVGIRYGWGRVIQQIADASPPEAEASQAAIDPLPDLLPDPGRIGSNAYAIGKALTANGRGLLLGNPHYPWQGPSRFHISHLTIPGELDIMGAGLYTTGTAVAIGFNRNVAWSHTVSTALRFTVFELSLVDGNPLAYHFGDEQRPLEARTVTVQVLGDDGSLKPREKTVYMSHFGPVFESADTPWTTSKAFVMRDVNFENNRSASQYYELDRATSVAEIEASLARHQGVSFVNTIAADKDGNAFYGDMSAIPYVDSELLERCRADLESIGGQRIIVLDGSKPDCQWKSDDSAAAPGLLPPAELPRLITRQYVTNSNDSYWLSNPDQPLEGYSPIVGDEETARSLRTRAGIRFIQEVIESGKKFDRQTVQDIMFNHRNYGAELLLDDILEICKGSTDDNISRGCKVLATWDRRQDIDSKGPQVYTELWDQLARVDNLYAVPFSVEDPVNTPRGINADDPAVKSAVLQGIATAVRRLDDAGIPLDAAWGEVQFVTRHGDKIGIPGGRGYMGMFSNIYAPFAEGQGYTPVVSGNSYIQVVTWDEKGNPDAAGILTYSQTQQPESPHYDDQTRLYSKGEWVKFPFTEEEIARDVKETLVLSTSPQEALLP